MKVEHLDTTDVVKETIATGVPNIGAKSSWEFDFPAMEKVLTNEKIRVTYTNTASEAMTLFVVLEQVG